MSGSVATSGGPAGPLGAAHPVYNRRVGTDDRLSETFKVLRGILHRHARQLRVVVDEPRAYQVASPTLVDRTGKPLFVAAAQITRNYVSFHLMPVYAVPEIREAVSPALRKRMQGKGCFNFTTIDKAQVKELEALTTKGIRQFEKIELPWAKKK
jgi:hypothetical protein